MYIGAMSPDTDTHPWDEPDFEDENWTAPAAEPPPRKNWQQLMTWTLIGAFLLGPLLTLQSIYQVEPVVLLVTLGLLATVAHIAHSRRREALEMIERMFQRRNND